MKKLILLFSSMLVMALFALPGTSFAEYTATSVTANVNLNIKPVSVVAITSTGVTLNVNEAKMPGADGKFSGVLDASATAGGTLSYTSNQNNKKITATLGGGLLTAPSGITIDVTALQGGVTKGHVTLGSGLASTADFITDLGATTASFDLSYEALVQLSVPPGTYAGVVTYTVADDGGILGL